MTRQQEYMLGKAWLKMARKEGHKSILPPSKIKLTDDQQEARNMRDAKLRQDVLNCLKATPLPQTVSEVLRQIPSSYAKIGSAVKQLEILGLVKKSFPANFECWEALAVTHTDADLDLLARLTTSDHPESGW